MREAGYGHLPMPGRLTREEDGTISEATLSRVYRQLELVTEAINGGLRLKAGENLGRAGNFKAQLLEFTTPGGADTEFSQPHSLGETPEGYFIVLQNKAGSVYTSNFGGWDSQTVYFKSDATDMLVNIIIYS
jgi:hypothetical protein